MAEAVRPNPEAATKTPSVDADGGTSSRHGFTSLAALRKEKTQGGHFFDAHGLSA